MPTYSISKMGKPVGAGGSKPWYFEVSVVGKWAVNDRLIVANEYICAALGSHIGLPIPPYALFEQKGTVPTIWFGSLNFSLTGLTLPPIDPVDCVQDFLELSTGITLFDIWITNADRYEGNLAIDKSKGAARLFVYDHGHALFRFDGAPRLIKMMDKFGIDQDAESGANRHCLLDLLPTDSHFETWIRRIETIPSWLIVKVCKDTLDAGLLSATEADRARIFLTYRAKEIRNIVERNKNEFKSMTWSWFSSKTADIWDGPHI